MEKEKLIGDYERNTISNALKTVKRRKCLIINDIPYPVINGNKTDVGFQVVMNKKIISSFENLLTRKKRTLHKIFRLMNVGMRI